jgi:hypothetical protein
LLEESSMPDGGVPMPDAGVPDGGTPTNPRPPTTVSAGCSAGHGGAPLDPIACLSVLGLALARRRSRRA